QDKNNNNNKLLPNSAVRRQIHKTKYQRKLVRLKAVLLARTPYTAAC
ncbi:MAG: hypothetical protein ACI883_000898, partial [Candidatus Azotimanducaceae bacterium]